jgi:hypothetical protein
MTYFDIWHLETTNHSFATRVPVRFGGSANVVVPTMITNGSRAKVVILIS